MTPVNRFEIYSDCHYCKIRDFPLAPCMHRRTRQGGRGGSCPPWSLRIPNIRAKQGRYLGNFAVHPLFFVMLHIVFGQHLTPPSLKTPVLYAYDSNSNAHNITHSNAHPLWNIWEISPYCKVRGKKLILLWDFINFEDFLKVLWVFTNKIKLERDLLNKRVSSHKY